MFLYDMCSYHIVKENRKCVCHIHKGNSEFTGTCLTAQADLSLGGGLRVNYVRLFTLNIHPHYNIST